MKKKLFGFIIAFVFILTGIMYLTACDDGNPTLSKIVVAVNNTEHETTYNFGDFEYGTPPSLAYKVYAKYSDDTKKELTSSDYSTEYQFNGGKIESLPTTYDIGSYSIKISYKGSEFTLFFNIIAATKTYQTILTPQKTQWTYGETQPEMKISDDTIQLESSAYRYIEKSKVANPNHLTQTELDESDFYNKEVALEPGEYYLFVVVPQTGNYAETTSTLKAVTVNKVNLVVDTAASTLIATYTYGSAVSGNFTAKDLQKPTIVIKTTSGEVFDLVEMDFAEPNKELNSTDNGKTLKLNFTLEEETQKYYNTPDPIDILLEINKATFDKPSIRYEENKIDIYVGEKDATTWYGDWSAYTLTVTKPDNTTESINIDSETKSHILLDKPTEAGKYTYTISLKDKVNFTWQDGTTEDQPLVCEIKEINMESLKWKVGNSGVTDGQAFTYSSDGYFPEIILPTGVGCDLSGYKYYSADGVELPTYPTETGSYYVTFNKNSVDTNDTCYIVTGELARFDYSIIAAGDDVTGKIGKFTGLKVVKADGTVPTPEDLESLSEIVSMTESISTNNINRTAKCESNGNVSGTCDFGSATFDQLILDENPYKYTYSPNRENTVEMFAEEAGVVIEESKLVGNLVDGILTLTMNIPDVPSTEFVWQFTFEFFDTTEA